MPDRLRRSARNHLIAALSGITVADKFRGCAEFARWPTAKANAVISSVRALESLPDVGKLTVALTR